jgi:DNA-binding IclR family transcriptional regulator
VQRLDDGRYILGNEIARLYRAYSSTFSEDRLIIPVLQELVDTTGESASYHVAQGLDRLCRYRVDSPHPVRDHIKPGDMLPLERGAGGRVLVAFDPALKEKEENGKYALYSAIRKKGYFSSLGDRLAEVAGISAPVFGPSRHIVAAVTLTIPAHRYTEDHIKPTVRAAQEITERLGGSQG